MPMTFFDLFCFESEGEALHLLLEECLISRSQLVLGSEVQK